MDLMNEIRGIVAKEKIGEEAVYTPNYSTGFDIIDVRNGRIEGGQTVLGFDGGKITTFIGKSGTGKTTLALQIAFNIIKNFKDGQVILLDYEHATNDARIEDLSKWSQNDIDKKFLHLANGLTSESLYGLVKSLSNLKLKSETYDEIKIKTDKIDRDGNVVYTLPPSIVIVDSWALMTPKDISEEEKLSGSMSATSIAKTNNSVIKRITPILDQANISLFIINHITQKIEINAFAKTQAAVNFLKQDESIPGGTSCIFLASVILKIIASTKLNEDDTFGIKGFKCIGEFIKCRSNESGRSFDLIFSQANGFDNILTDLSILKENGYLKGSPRAYYLDGCPDVKFTMKQFKEKYLGSKELQKATKAAVEECFLNFIPNTEKLDTYKSSSNPDMGDDTSDDEAEIELVECVNEEEDIWLGSDGRYYTSDGEEVEIEEE